MKNKKKIFFLTALVAIGLFINSCKKDNQNSRSTLLTRAPWQLASVMVFNYVGTSQVGATDTLNTTCDSTQIFTFGADHTCKYTNFECLPQKSSGTWSLSSDQLTLMSTLAATDTLPGNIIDPVKIMPFANTKIVTLGIYSMVLQTGGINIFVTPTTRYRIVQYGFVHQATNTQ